jgi:hypothetical protein
MQAKQGPGFQPLIFIHKSISAAKLLYREAVRDHSPGLLGLGFCQKEFALKGRPNAMIFRHGSQGIHFHPFPSVPLQGGFRWSFPKPEGLGCSVKPLRGSLKSTYV